MELDDIVEKYRSSKMNVRIMIAVIVGLLPVLYYWSEEGDNVQMDLDAAFSNRNKAKSKLEKGKRKVKKLPELLTRLTEIESELEIAKRILPDRVRLDSILGAIGELEKEYSVQVTRFEPGEESRVDPKIEVMERPVKIEVRGQFSKIMQFFDSLVHLPNLTQLRDIELQRMKSADTTRGNRNIVNGKANLIIFRGM